jgi:1-acyl-sn-glycerol-3-phosphate acyltransferase
MTWYAFLRLLAMPFAHLVARLDVVGKENIPRDGPFILVANHQSLLDPILVQVICPRPLYTLTKSTQFRGTVWGWLMPRVNAIPTRRYRIDPQAVRVVLRRLSQGEAVGVYPEGERSWDTRLQPFRRGTIRLLLKAGVPVVPCWVAGSYDVWPRWSRTIRRRWVRVEFGQPLNWPALDGRQERNAVLPDAVEALRSALESLSGDHASPPSGRSTIARESSLAGEGPSSAATGRSSGVKDSSLARGDVPSNREDGSPGGRASEPPLPGWLRGGGTIT